MLCTLHCSGSNPQSQTGTRPHGSQDHHDRGKLRWCMITIFVSMLHTSRNWNGPKATQSLYPVFYKHFPVHSQLVQLGSARRPTTLQSHAQANQQAPRKRPGLNIWPPIAPAGTPRKPTSFSGSTHVCLMITNSMAIANLERHAVFSTFTVNALVLTPLADAENQKPEPKTLKLGGD